MATVNITNWNKEKVGQVELASNVFEVEVKKDVLHTVVRWQLASRRQGTHMTKTKGLVSGGGKKPFKQKGTGNARQGSTRSPLMPGGGTMFGPSPRNYAYVLPKKTRKVGLSMALSYLLKDKTEPLITRPYESSSEEHKHNYEEKVQTLCLHLASMEIV